MLLTKVSAKTGDRVMIAFPPWVWQSLRDGQCEPGVQVKVRWTSGNLGGSDRPLSESCCKTIFKCTVCPAFLEGDGSICIICFYFLIFLSQCFSENITFEWSCKFLLWGETGNFNQEKLLSLFKWTILHDGQYLVVHVYLVLPPSSPFMQNCPQQLETLLMFRKLFGCRWCFCFSCFNFCIIVN